MSKMIHRLGALAIAATMAAANPSLGHAQQPASTTAQEIVHRGAPIGKSPAVALATVLQSPQEFTRRAVVVEGVVDRACTNKGCWMQLSPAAGTPGIRVTFKDYAFFVPTTAAGMRARAEGVITVKRHSKKDADHLIGEGAVMTRNADGTATEISFVASGVELRP